MGEEAWCRDLWLPRVLLSMPVCHAGYFDLDRDDPPYTGAAVPSVWIKCEGLWAAIPGLPCPLSRNADLGVTAPVIWVERACQHSHLEHAAVISLSFRQMEGWDETKTKQRHYLHPAMAVGRRIVP
jgi:hypothetical protein